MHQIDWIIALLVTVSISISCTAGTTSTTSAKEITTNKSKYSSRSSRSSDYPTHNLSNRDIKHLWASTFQAINEAELQRRTPSPPLAPKVEVAPQRINSKLLKWRSNSKVLNERESDEQRELQNSDRVEARDFSYTQTEDTNSDYINVKDYTPSPIPWWF